MCGNALACVLHSPPPTRCSDIHPHSMFDAGVWFRIDATALRMWWHWRFRAHTSYTLECVHVRSTPIGMRMCVCVCAHSINAGPPFVLPLTMCILWLPIIPQATKTTTTIILAENLRQHIHTATIVQAAATFSAPWPMAPSLWGLPKQIR